MRDPIERVYVDTDTWSKLDVFAADSVVLYVVKSLWGLDTSPVVVLAVYVPVLVNGKV